MFFTFILLVTAYYFYDKNQKKIELKRHSSKRLVVDVPTFNIEDIISVKSKKDIKIVRDLLVKFIWHRDELPLDVSRIQKIEVEDVEGQSDEWYEVEMPYQVNSIIRFYKGVNSECLNILHNGHTTQNGGWEPLTEFMIAMKGQGCDLVYMNMPLHADNNRPEVLIKGFGIMELRDHKHLQMIESQDFTFIRYFLEPVLQVVNFFDDYKNYKSINLIGHSGGGWTTVLYAALDERIKKSVSHAGSLPLFIRSVKPYKPLADAEQVYMPLLRIANYLDLYVLGTSHGRSQLNIYNEYDNCCFAGSESNKVYEPEIKNIVSQWGGEFEVYISKGHKSHAPSSESLSYIHKYFEK